ncbi:hypothetical protein [uncultured Arenimonas sp.]|uniref:hypothetical protein n=1 Tax=uncultured Arenimonas sp. TaxID=546226 RepID=UPI0030DA091A
MSEKREPLHAICADCAYVWVVLYMPMAMEKAAEAMAHATCAQCGSTDARVHFPEAPASQPSQEPAACSSAT